MKSMPCPHCQVMNLDFPRRMDLGSDADGRWLLLTQNCLACERIYIKLQVNLPGADDLIVIDEYFVRPQGTSRAPVPKEVPATFAEDYLEACLVLNDSPKASAALSRRCLQHILRDKAGAKGKDLYQEIQYVIEEGGLSSDLADSLHDIRNIGNFSAHPNKSTRTGEILPVEPGEAEWCLQVIEDLFDHYFVKPELNRQRRAALAEKRREAGKGPRASQGDTASSEGESDA